MNVDRNTMRLALPPVVALAFVAVLSTPLSASSALADVQRSGSGTAQSAVLSPPQSQPNTKVSIGAVAFTEHVAIANGHLRTPVLLAAVGVTGTAAVTGASTGAGCTAELATGSPVWLDCDLTVAPGAEPAVVVTLSDGRAFEKSITLG